MSPTLRQDFCRFLLRDALDCLQYFLRCVSHRLYRIVACIYEELDVALGQPGHALIAMVSAVDKMPHRFAAYLQI